MNTAMNTAVLKLIDYMYAVEYTHFTESLKPHARKCYGTFKALLQEHILYSLIVLNNNGDEALIETAIRYIWTNDVYNEDEEEDDEEDPLVTYGFIETSQHPDVYIATKGEYKDGLFIKGDDEDTWITWIKIGTLKNGNYKIRSKYAKYREFF